MGEHQLSFEPLAVQLHDWFYNHDQVEVGGEHLACRAFGGVLAHEARSARHDIPNDSLVVPLGKVDDDLIADNGSHAFAFHDRRGVFAANRDAVVKLDKREPPVEPHNRAHALH